jgi:putative membrane protein
LVLDAIPGIVLRLHRGLVSGYFDHRAMHPWSASNLHDQQTAGSILWVISEVIDLPFLLLVFRRWLRADARDAAEVDAILDAEHAARAGLDGPPDREDTGTADVPWWVSDPAMQRRLRNQG